MHLIGDSINNNSITPVKGIVDEKTISNLRQTIQNADANHNLQIKKFSKQRLSHDQVEKVIKDSYRNIITIKSPRKDDNEDKTQIKVENLKQRYEKYARIPLGDSLSSPISLKNGLDVSSNPDLSSSRKRLSGASPSKNLK